MTVLPNVWCPQLFVNCSILVFVDNMQSDLGINLGELAIFLQLVALLQRVTFTQLLLVNLEDGYFALFCTSSAVFE